MTERRTKPTVLHVVGASRYGGVYEVVFNLCELADANGLEPLVLTTDPEAVTQCRLRDLNVVEFQGIIRPIRPWRDLYDAIRLARLIRRLRPALVHTHVTKGGLIGRLAAHLSRIDVPVVHTHHGLPFNQYSSWSFRAFAVSVERIASSWCDKIILMNQADIDLASKHSVAPRERVAYIPNGISDPAQLSITPDSREALIGELQIPGTSILVGNVCRLSPQKNLEQFIQSIAQLPAVGEREVHGILVGDGDQRDRLTQLANSTGAGSRVHFLGYREDRLALMKAFDVFLTTSLYEGMSISLLEAMALGSRIIATDVRGNSDCITDGVEGLLVQVGSPESVAASIVKLSQDTALAAQLSQNARIRFESDFTKSQMLQTTWDLVYSTLLT